MIGCSFLYIYTLLVFTADRYIVPFDYFYLTDSIPQKYVGQVVTLPDSSFHTTLGAYIGCSEKEFCDKYRKINFSVSRHTAGNTYTFQDSINLYRSVYKFTHGYLSYVEFGYVW